MLDERAVSWKVLLSVPENGRVLVCGLGVGEVVGLARTWPQVDWLCGGSAQNHLSDISPHLAAKIELIDAVASQINKYDLVVLGEKKISIADILNCLDENGTLVLPGFVGCSQSVSQLSAAGFEAVQEYGVLPVDRPRVIYPLKDKRLRSKALCLHSPGSRRALLALKVVKIISNIGLIGPMAKGAVTFAWRQAAPVSGSLQLWLQKQLHCEIVGLVVYCGSDSPGRKITLLAVGAKGRDDFIVKVAETKAGIAAVKQESKALESLKAMDLPAHIPQILLSALWGSYFVQVQSALSKSQGQIATLTDEHLNFLVALADIERRFMRLADTNVWQQVVADTENTNIDFPEGIRKLADEVCSVGFGEKKLCFCRTHGDFTPWNMTISNGSLVVWDWEDSAEQGLVFTDICHFIIRQAILVGPWLGAAGILDLIRRFCVRLIDLSRLPDDTDYIPALQIWLLQEYLSQPSNHILELVAFLS